MLLSIIIPAYNEAALIGMSLQHLQDALGAQDYPGFSWEILVCDNNSSDQTAQIAREAGAKVIFEPINQIAKARNTGASIAQGDWLLFMDADSYPPVGLIGDLLQHIATDRFVGLGSTVEVFGGTVYNKLRIERLNPLMRLLNWSGGAFIACETVAFRQINGFSEELFALEEIDLIIRLRRFGRKKKQRFKVLHQYALKTSGRKGALTWKAFFMMAGSITVSVFLFVLHYILPKRWRIKNPRRLLGFWYNRRSTDEAE